MTKKFFSIKAAAVAVNRSQETIRRWCRRGLIGYQPVPGAQWVIPEDDFKKLLGEQPVAGEMT